jgi:N-acetylneuraminate synthase
MIYIIAEIGINHNGSLDITKQLIDMAVSCGCDAVKFQKRNPDVCVPDDKKNDMRDTPWGYISYLDYKKKIEFGKKEYNEIDKYCKKNGVDWLASAWDFDSLKFLEQYDLKLNKVPSALTTYIPFLEKVAEQGKKTLISTGMCTLHDVDKAVKVFTDYKCSFVLNHCVSTYPSAPEDINLNVIQTLKKRYNCEVGYSGHEVDLLPSVLAVALGATYIERHITLDRAMFGTDQAASLEKRGLELLVRDARLVNTLLGNSEKKISPSEKDVAKKQRYWC